MNGANQNGVDDSGGWATSRRFYLVLGAALFAAFPLVMLGDRTLFSRDFGALGYPGAVFFRDCLFRGELPLWNPCSHCGVPFLAQMGTWYPPGWLALLLPLPWALNFSMLAHLFFGGVGMHRLARRWGAGGPAAALAAFAFVFNGVTLSCLLWGNYIASLAWLPWVVLTVMEAWRGGGRALAWAALASAMQVLTATPELTLLTWLFLGGFWLMETCSGPVKFWPSLGRLSAVVLIAAGLTMVQMLPFYDLLRHSQRETGNAEAALWAMPGWGWANLLVPLFHCYRGPEGNWFQNGQEFLQSYYPGAVVLALGLTGALLARSRRTLALAGMILFCWVMALGADGFFYDRLRAVFPVVGIARFPVKFAVLPAFLLPLLAAQGLELVLQAEAKRARRLFAGVVVALFGLGVALMIFLREYPFPNDDWNATALNALERGGILLAAAAAILGWSRATSRAAKMILFLLVPALLVVDAFRHSPKLVPTLPAGVMASGMWEADGRPPVRLGQGRVMLSPAAEARLNYNDVADFKTDFLSRRVAEWYNLNLLDGVPKVAGAFTLRPARFDFIERRLYHSSGPGPGEGLLDFLSVAWTTSPQNLLEWVTRTNFMPVITAGQGPRFADDDGTWAGIAAKDFDPRAEVFLLESQRALVTVSNRTQAVVSNAQFAGNRVEADVTAAGPALVVLSQVNYHCWRAAVDGQTVPILTANLAFQALQVPAGTHHIGLVYRDSNLVIGAVISLLSLAVVLVLLAGSSRPGGPVSPGGRASFLTGAGQWLGSRPGRFTLLAVAAAVSLPPIFAETPRIGLDPSWHLSLQLAAMKGLVFGRDFVFTYGPLGYLLIHAAVSKAVLLGYDLFVLGSLVSLYRRLLPQRPAPSDALLLVLLAAVTKICWGGAPVTVLFTLLCYWLWSVCERGDAPAVAGSLIAGTVLFFGKVNYGLIVTFLIPAYAAGLFAFQRGRRIQAILLLPGFPVLICLGAWIWHVDLPRYLYSGIQLVTGYQEAMFSYSSELFPAVSLGCLFLAGMGVVAYAGRHRLSWREQALFLPLIGLAALLLFKNAFLRADVEHASSFYAGLPLLLAWWCIGWPGAKTVRGLLFAGLFCSIALLSMQPGSFGRPFSNELMPFKYCRQVLTVPWRETAGHLQEGVLAAYPQSVFPADVQSAIGSATVDVMPSESSMAVLNGLNYHARPVPQSYSAYTRWLDRLNAGFLESSNAPAFIIYAFDRNARVDSRPAAWDESLTKTALLENYAFDREFQVPIRWPGAETAPVPFFLLKRSPHCRRLVPVATNEITLALGQTLSLPASTNLVFLTLHVNRTIPGKLAACALSPAMLMVRFEYQNGHNACYEAVLPILKLGVLVNRRVEVAEEARNWLRPDSTANPAVASICFNTFHPWAFQSPLKGSLVEYRVVENRQETTATIPGAETKTP